MGLECMFCFLFFLSVWVFKFCSSGLKLWDVRDKKPAKISSLCQFATETHPGLKQMVLAHTLGSLNARQRVVPSSANWTCAESSVNHNNSCGDVEQLWLRGFACRAACVAIARICSAGWNNITRLHAAMECDTPVVLLACGPCVVVDASVWRDHFICGALWLRQPGLRGATFFLSSLEKGK